MQQFLEATRCAIDNENWYAALSLALTLPDIASKLEHPTVKGAERYADWCNAYLTPKYTRHDHNGRVLRVFMSGSDTYALRCAVLHQGIDQTTRMDIQNRVRGFRFLAPRPGTVVHENLINGQLQLQVDFFCHDICDAVDVWWMFTGNCSGVAERVSNLMKIEHAAG
jgi:hypothetical protein